MACGSGEVSWTRRFLSSSVGWRREFNYTKSEQQLPDSVANWLLEQQRDCASSILSRRQGSMKANSCETASIGRTYSRCGSCVLNNLLQNQSSEPPRQRLCWIGVSLSHLSECTRKSTAVTKTTTALTAWCVPAFMNALAG